jgi:anti-anti-sigma factor
LRRVRAGSRTRGGARRRRDRPRDRHGPREKPLLELFDSGFRDVVVDLHDVAFMDSSGIRVLITAHQHAEKLGGRLSIVVGASRIRQTLELSGAIDYLGVG